MDANALIHRSYHALPPLTTPKGEQVNAVYGFANALLKAIKDERPDYAVACFDVGKGTETFRSEIYPEYKAQRKESDESLYSQIPRVKEIVEALNIPLYAQARYEADDLIGSLAKIAGGEGLQVVIVTGDNDALQLVNDSVAVYSLRRGVTDTLTFHRQEVKEKIGVFPEQIVDYKALAGDASDNIPGAPGIGPKTAVDLLNQYQTLDGIYQHLDQLKERTKQILTDHKNQVYMSQKLATIKQDLKIDLDLKKASVENFDFSKVVNLFHELGFKSLLTKLPTADDQVQGSLFGTTKTPAEKIEAKLAYEAVDNLERWQVLSAILKKQPYLAVDTETDALDGNVIGISFAWGKDDACYLPVAPHYKQGLPFDKLKADLAEILGNAEIKKIGHAIKYDLHALLRLGLKTRGVYFDTMIASQLINSQLFSHSLDDLAFSEFGFKKIPISQLIGMRKKDSMADAPLGELAAYACEDALITWRLWEKFRPEMEEKFLKRIFYEIEMPLLPVLTDMEETGIKLDRAYLAALAKKWQQNLAQIEREIWQLSGVEFNVASPPQLQNILFNQLKLPVVGIKKIKSGYSTDSDSLAKLKSKHPIIEKIIQYRELAKLLSTYALTLPNQTDESGRLHTSYMQIGAATGRMASTEPNLQNIPIRTELGNDVRRAFIAGKGKVLLEADYSQAELRILAHLSEDPGLIEAFRRGEDFHAAVAKQMGVERRAAKTINFGVLFGQGPQALSNDLGISMSEAKAFIDKYFATFPLVAAFIKKCHQQARELGYTTTYFGRKRYLPDVHSPNMMMRSGAERMAFNMPIQGCLQYKTRVLTSSGYLPIGYLYQNNKELPAKVWDGNEWQDFDVVNRGKAELAQIFLSNGQILNCDTRHEVLVIDDLGYKWKHYSKLNKKDLVCLSLPKEIEFSPAPLPRFSYKSKTPNSLSLELKDFDSELWYWVGYYVGDGHMSVEERNRHTLAYTFGLHETVKRKKCQAFFQALGFKPKLRLIQARTSSGNVSRKESLEIHSRACIELFRHLGIESNENAHNKRLPHRIFEESLYNRKAFLRGVMESDGYVGTNTRLVPNIHLCQRDLLSDILLIFRSVGVESKISKVCLYKGKISYFLRIKRRDLAKIMPESIQAASYTRDNGHTLPKFIAEAFIRLYPTLPHRYFAKPSDYVIYRRILNGGNTSIYHFKEWIERNNLKVGIPLYTWAKVDNKQGLGIYEDTYTLSVKNELHRFDSEGIISKNTEADIIKLAMDRIAQKLPDGAKMILQVHDELVFEVAKDQVEQTSKIVQETMESVVEFKVPMKADVKVGPNWAEMTAAGS